MMKRSNNLKNVGLVLGGLAVGAFLISNLNGGLVKGLSAKSTLDWGKEVNAGKCVKPSKQVINVTEKVENSVDSGEGGNYWAYDNYNRQIQVWEQEEGTFCVTVRYQGDFDSQAGQTSPGAGATLDGDEDGSFEGGYRATVTGTLMSSPLWQTNGNVGIHDFQCDISGSCPGKVNWLDQYFNAGYSFAYDWWGWIYHAGKSGTWVNSVDGNEGDIN